MLTLFSSHTRFLYIPITLYLLRWPNFLGVQYMYHYLVIYFDLPILGCMLHSSIYIQLIVIFHVHIPLLVLCKILHNYTLSGVEIISPVLFLKHCKFFFFIFPGLNRLGSKNTDTLFWRPHDKRNESHYKNINFKEHKNLKVINHYSNGSTCGEKIYIIINLSPYGDELYIKILQQIHNSLLKCVDFSVMNDSL